MDRTYTGNRDQHGMAYFSVSYTDSQGEHIGSLRHYQRESVAGMDYGYFGAASRDLAFSILVDHYTRKGDSYEVARKKADDYSRAFAFNVICRLTHNRDWKMTTEYIDEMLRERCSFQPTAVAL